jgi:hypothetical protein
MSFRQYCTELNPNIPLTSSSSFYTSSLPWFYFFKISRKSLELFVDISRSNCTKCTQILFIIIPKNPRKAKEILGKIHKSFAPQTPLESIIQILDLNSLSESKLSLVWISKSFCLNP